LTSACARAHARAHARTHARAHARTHARTHARIHALTDTYYIKLHEKQNKTLYQKKTIFVLHVILNI